MRLWISELRRNDESYPGRRVRRLCALQSLVLAVLGVLAGWGVAAAVFSYDGSRPVNVVHVLAVFVGLQLLLLCGLAVVMLPADAGRRLRFLAGAQETLLWFSPGQLSRLTVRMLPERAREVMRRVFRFDDFLGAPLGGVVRWWLVQSAQVFGVMFYVGALGTAVYLVVFSDLAFAWSTTLKADAEQVRRVTDCLSWPWASWLPGAVPSRELIEQTQYFRRAGAGLSAAPVEPSRWGEWWPFLVACMAGYGLIPRAGLLVFSIWRLRSRMRRALLEAPGAALVWDRLTSQMVTTQAGVQETEGLKPAEAWSERAPPTMPAAREFLVINWGGLDYGDANLAAHVQATWRAGVAQVLHAGGRASVDADTKALETAARLPASAGVGVFLKGWEPPVLEALDFLRELRSCVGPGRLIVVCLVGWAESGGPAVPAEAHVMQWQRKLRATGDRALAVRPWPGGITS
jgi:hypothetical protein